MVMNYFDWDGPKVKWVICNGIERAILMLENKRTTMYDEEKECL